MQCWEKFLIPQTLPHNCMISLLPRLRKPIRKHSYASGATKFCMDCACQQTNSSDSFDAQRAALYQAISEHALRISAMTPDEGSSVALRNQPPENLSYAIVPQSTRNSSHIDSAESLNQLNFLKEGWGRFVVLVWGLFTTGFQGGRVVARNHSFVCVQPILAL